MIKDIERIRLLRPQKLPKMKSEKMICHNCKGYTVKKGESETYKYFICQKKSCDTIISIKKEEKEKKEETRKE